MDPSHGVFPRATSSRSLRTAGTETRHTVIAPERFIISAANGEYERAMATLASECFPTLGRGRDVLIALWQACAVGKAKAVTAVEAHAARKASPVPRNIGCPYATLYCENYW